MRENAKEAPLSIVWCKAWFGVLADMSIVTDTNATWRVIFRIDEDAIVLLEIFSKKAQNTLQYVIKTCRKRIRDYDNG